MLLENINKMGFVNYIKINYKRLPLYAEYTRMVVTDIFSNSPQYWVIVGLHCFILFTMSIDNINTFYDESVWSVSKERGM